MNKTAKLPRTTKSRKYDKRFTVTKMINDENKAISREVIQWKVACISTTVATLMATISYFAK